MPYCWPTDVIFLAVAGRGVDGAGALFERDVIGEDAEGIALEERMAEDGVLRAARPGRRRALREVAPAAFFGGDVEQVGGDDVDVACHIDGDVLELRMEGDGHVGRDGPGRGGPDEAVDLAAGERGIDGGGVGRECEANPDGRAGVVLVLDLGFGQRGAVVDAPVDGLETFVDVAAIEEIDERAGDDRLVLRRSS